MHRCIATRRFVFYIRKSKTNQNVQIIVYNEFRNIVPRCNIYETKNEEWSLFVQGNLFMCKNCYTNTLNNKVCVAYNITCFIFVATSLG